MGVDEEEFLSRSEKMFAGLAEESEIFRNYEKGFVEISKALSKDHGLDITSQELTRQFMLALKDELESIPRAQWRFDSLTWFKDLEFKARERVIEELNRQIELNKKTG